MAYDKVIDSAFLDDGLTAIADKIREKGAATDSLAFPNDFVTAIDAIEGGGEAEKQTMQKFVIDLSSITTGTNSLSFVAGQTYYKSVNNGEAIWQGADGETILTLANIGNAKGRYLMSDISKNRLYYVTDSTAGTQIYTVQVIDLTSLASSAKTYVSDYEGDFPPGTYEFAGGQIYYYSYGASSAPRAKTEKDVNFYDYDGTLLYSYTLPQMQALSQLPPLPTRDGLICQEWNWTLDELKALGRGMTVGASYITDDGATRLYLDIPKDARKTVPLHFSQSVSGGVTVDWGDGSAAETVSGTGYISTSHTYAEGGEYMISLMPSDSCNIILGNGTDTSVIGATKANTDYYKGSILVSANIGKNVSLGKCAFEQSIALKKISMPSATAAGTAMYSASCFERCFSLNFAVLSRANTFLGAYLFNESKGLSLVSLPPTLSGSSEGPFGYCSGLKRIDIPDGVSALGWNSFREGTSLSLINKNDATRLDESSCRLCISLKRAVIGEGQKTINYAFENCYSLSEADIPSTVTSLNNGAFANCYGMTRYDFTKCTAVPTLGNTNVFNGIPEDCIIVVPDDLLAEWKAATNWSTYASHIKGASEV